MHMKLSLSSGVLVPKYSRVTCHQAYNLLSHGSGKKKKKDMCRDIIYRARNKTNGQNVDS